MNVILTYKNAKVRSLKKTLKRVVAGSADDEWPGLPQSWVGIEEERN
jgi:hypothetical protein